MITDDAIRALMVRLEGMRPARAEDARTLERVRGLCSRALAGDERARLIVGWLIEATEA